jgi:GT2 family glycosyltransferase
MKRFLELGYSFLLLLNNDTVVRKGAVKTMLGTMRSDPKVGVVGPAVLNMGSEVVQSVGVSIVWERSKPVMLKSGTRYAEVDRGITDVDFVSGCAMLLRREAVEKAGMFPEHFFMYVEEQDLCLSIKEAGFRVVCDSRAAVEHRAEATVSKYPKLKARYYTRNRFLVLKRHGTSEQMLRFVAYMFLRELPGAVLRDLEAKSLSSSCTRNWAALEGLAMAAGEHRGQGSSGSPFSLSDPPAP